MTGQRRLSVERNNGDRTVGVTVVASDHVGLPLATIGTGCLDVASVAGADRTCKVTCPLIG